jgi:hypothetical protein
MRIFDFFIKKRDASLIEKLDLYKFLENLNEEEMNKFKQYSESVLNENKIKIKDFENKTTVTFRSITSLEDNESNSTFLIRSATDFMSDVGDFAIKDGNYILAEKILEEAINVSKNNYDTHYAYEKIIQLYSLMIEEDSNCFNKYVNVCEKDMDIFSEIRKSSHNEYITIAKRSYKAAIISEDEYIYLMQKAKVDIILPLAKSFKTMVELCIKVKNFDKAFSIIYKALCYDISEKDKSEIEYLKSKIDISKKEYEQFKVDERIRMLEDKIDKENKVLKNENIKRIEPDLKKMEEIDNNEKNTKYFDEIYRIEKEILNYTFLKNNSLEKAKEKLIKIISTWERGGISELIPAEIFFTLSHIYYFENSDDKSIKVLSNYLKSAEKLHIDINKIKKAEKLKSLIENKQLKRDYAFTGPDKDEYKNLLALANEEYKNKNYDKAAYLAKKAKEISDITDIYPNITEILKIPMYLQKAKRYEEAWAVYNRLLEERFQDNVDYLGISKIYDKMRVQLQNEKRFRDAMIMGFYSYMWDAAELKKTGNMAQYEKYTMKVELIKLSESLLKKLKQEDLKDKVADIISKYIIFLPEIDKDKFEEELKISISDTNADIE